MATGKTALIYIYFLYITSPKNSATYRLDYVTVLS